MIATINSTKIKGNEITDFNHLIAGHAMGQSTASTTGYNSVKGILFTAVGTHIILQATCQAALRASRTNIVQELHKGFIGNAGGLEQKLQLLFVLDHANTAKIHAFHGNLTQKLLQRHIISIAIAGTIKAHHLGSGLLCQSGGCLPNTIGIGGSIFQDLENFHFLLGLLGIASIGNQNALLAVQIKQAGIAGKAGKIADRGNILDNDTVHCKLGHEL